MRAIVKPFLGGVGIRTLGELPIESVAAWVSSFHWDPAPLGGASLSADDLATFFEERGVIELFVATYDDTRIVGSLALYPMSALKSSSGRSLWMDTFAIHPEFRLSTVPLRLFTSALRFCIDRGYDRIDGNAAPSNPAMTTLLTAGGFRRPPEAACSDDRLTFRCYYPYLARLFASALEIDLAGDELSWRRLTGKRLPRLRRPASEHDAEPFHGSQVFRYEVGGSEVGDVDALVDIEIDEVCAIRCGPLAAEVRPERRTTTPSTAVAVHHELSNRSRRPMMVRVIEPLADGTDIDLHRGVLQPGECLVGASPALVGPGRTRIGRVIEATLDDSGRVARFPLSTWVDGEAAGAPLTPTRQDWRLENRWIRVDVDEQDGTTEISSPVSGAPGIRELWPDVGPPYPGAVKSRPQRRLWCTERTTSGGRTSLVLRSPASVWWDRHGDDLMRYHGASSAAANLELERRISIGDDAVVLVETTVHGTTSLPIDTPLRLRVHPWTRGRALTLASPVRGQLFRVPLVYERLPFAMHALELTGSLDLPRSPAAYDERWSAMSTDGGVAGVLWDADAEVRYGLQWLPSLLFDLAGGERVHDRIVLPPYAYYCGPGDHDAVRAARAAHFGGGCTVHRGAPAAPRVQPEGRTRRIPVPVHVTAPAFAGRSVPVSVTSLSPRTRTGAVVVSDRRTGAVVHRFDTVLNPEASTTFDVPVATDEVDVAWDERFGRSAAVRVRTAHQASAPEVRAEKSTWVVANERVSLRVAPAFGGAIVAFAVDGRPIVASPFPKRRPLGIVAAALGGINVSLAADRTEPAATLSQELQAWTFDAGAPVQRSIDRLTWAGIALDGNPTDGCPTAAAVHLEYLVTPSVPGVLVVSTVLGPQPCGSREIVTSVHCRGAGNWRFSFLREGVEFLHEAAPHGSNRPMAWGSSIGALRSHEVTMVAAATGDAEVGGANDDDDWTLRTIVAAEERPGSPSTAATMLLAVEPNAPLADEVGLLALAETARRVVLDG